MNRTLALSAFTIALASISVDSLAATQNSLYFLPQEEITLDYPTPLSGELLYAGHEVNYGAQAIAEGSYPVLTVWPGSGLTLNFTKLEQSVKQVWLDDPSKLVVDYAGELCNAPCRGGVQVLHLKRVFGLKFENLPSTPTTTLTVVTVSHGGEKIYKFRLTYGEGSAKYLTVTLNPTQTAKPESIPSLTPVVAKSAPSQENIVPSRIKTFERGLEVAQATLDDTTRNRFMFTRVEYFIGDLRQGYSEEVARERNNLSPRAVEALVKMGSEAMEAAE